MAMHGSLRNIFRNFGWLMSSRATAAALSLVYLAMATRSLGPTGFGHFALILSTAQAVTTFVTFQNWQIIVQYGHRWLAVNNSDGLARLVRGCIVLDIGSALAGALLMTVAMLFLGPWFGVEGELARDAILFGLVLLLTIRSTPIGVLRLRDRYASAAVADTMTPVTRMVGAVVVLLVDPTVRGFLIAWAGAEIITAASFWWAAARTGDLGAAWRARTSPASWSRENEGIAGFAWTTNLASTLRLGSKQLAAVLVGIYVGAAAAGGYRLVQQLALGLNKLSELLARAAFPELVRSATPGGSNGHKLMLRMTMGAAASAVALFLLLLAAGKPLLWLLGGEAYVPAYPVLIILGGAACVELAATAFEPALLASGKAARALWIRTAATACTLGLMFVLLDDVGLTGAAIAVLAGSVVSAVMMAVSVFTSRQSEPVSAGH